MLTMKMFRTRVEFEWDDQEVNSTVTISDQDDQDSVIRKLKRVIALVEGEQAEPRLNVTKYPTMRPVAAERMADEAPPTNGWAAAYGPPKVPEHLEGEVELVQPGEGA